MSFVEVCQGDSPIVLGLPHTGTDLPEDSATGLTEVGRALADTDWFVDELYAGLLPDLTTVRTRVHRYVIDVNRDPSGQSLYPGQNTTALCPVTDFDGNALYHPGAEPDDAEVARRLETYHAPYHAALRREMERVREMHGVAILYDCHSIRSVAPYLFAGRLPDLNIGTNDSTSCALVFETAVASVCAAAGDYTSVVNGRFKGGWTTRHYGRPAEGWHAIQMELAQSTYLKAEAPPWPVSLRSADRLRAVLTLVLKTLSGIALWRPS
ncbi:MAG: N-formylglutamate deformylase [Pseudomonadota bacterium]